MPIDEYRYSALRVRYNVLKQELSEAEQRQDRRFREIERELRRMEASEAEDADA
jgi:hypothetical protein